MDAPLWVFAYGSLMWNPDFPVAETHVARLPGWQRRFCMWSVHYRGSATDPGLVLALDQSQDGQCEGLAFRVSPGAEAATRAALRERELISYAYLEQFLPIDLPDGRRVEALCYVINRDHDQYGGDMSLEDQAAIIARAAGDRGPNADYLWNTVVALAGQKIAEPDLDWLAARVRDLRT